VVLVVGSFSNMDSVRDSHRLLSCRAFYGSSGSGSSKVRKCRLQKCRKELPTKKNSNFYQSAGFCDVDHMAEHGQVKRREQMERKAKAEHKAAKERIKTKSKWTQEAQQAVNAYVRERDAALPCVSCQRHHQGQYHAGHYRSVGSAPELRFETIQIWKQCAPCNNHLSGNLINYRIELIKRIGQNKVDWIEGPHEAKKYTIDDLRNIRGEYRAKLKALKQEMAA